MPFRAGQSGNPLGRPRGARDKLGSAFVHALAQDFDVHGAKVIAKVRRDRPHDYLKIVASTIPKDAGDEALLTRSADQFSDEELMAVIVNGLSDEQLKSVIEIGRDGAEDPDAGEVVDGKSNA
jgi:hypothetical protein